MAITGKDSVCKEVCDALGLKNVRKLDLHMSVDDVVIVKVEYYPEINDIEKLVPILKKYQLVEKE
jgi:hypothetical protein